MSVIGWRRPLTTFGFVIGIGLIVWAAFPAFDWRWALPLIAVIATTAALLDTLVASVSKQTVSSPSGATIDQRVTSHDQSGGITAHTINAPDDYADERP